MRCVSTPSRPVDDWPFFAEFEPRAFAWNESPRAVKSIRRAVSELRKLSRVRTPDREAAQAAAGAGAVEWLARLEDALLGVDGSSGALGNAVTRALDSLIPIIAEAPVDEATRDAWLNRLGARFLVNAGMGVELAGLGEVQDVAELFATAGPRDAAAQGLVHEAMAARWGALCGARASSWAERLLPSVRRAWGEAGVHAPGAVACLSALLAAGRRDELLSLLSLRTIACWPERQFGVRALAADGHVDAAIVYARASNPLGHDHGRAIAELCESILIAADQRARAYREFAITANRRQNCLQTFKAICNKYPEHDASSILADLIGASPGEEGKWFATARALRFFQLATEIATRAPCDPRTLNRAALERLAADPQYALELGLSSLRWIIEGHGVEIGADDVLEAHDIVIRAGHQLGGSPELMARLRDEMLRLCELPAPTAPWVRELLASEIE